ncbi:hypothetical protein [Flavobacterium magnum]|nr:hypothetical protein [Flavobacterium magnum]
MDGTTIGADPGYDCMGFSTSVFYTLLGTDAYIIQGRPLPFTGDDVIPLGYKAAQAGSFTLSIPDADGLFEAQDILVRDKLDGTLHNVSEAPYTFTSNAGIFNDRFEVLYADMATASVLSAGTDNTLARVQVCLAHGTLSIQSPKNIATVNLYDTSGRLLTSRSHVNAPTVAIEAGWTKQVLIVQAVALDGSTVTRKVIQ